MTFYSGQKVVCVDDAPCACCLIQSGIKNGNVYTVLKVWVNEVWPHEGILAMTILEAEPGGKHIGFGAYERFRPAVEDKTDISVFTKLLNKQPEKVP